MFSMFSSTVYTVVLQCIAVYYSSTVLQYTVYTVCTDELMSCEHAV